MEEPCLADFYHGWLIEVRCEESGFRSVCYSPSRQRLSDYTSHPSDFQALSAAKRLIDKNVTRYLLASFLRDRYELGQLSFEEWRSLNQSLNATIGVR
jgi:hypothetical protein